MLKEINEIVKDINAPVFDKLDEIDKLSVNAIMQEPAIPNKQGGPVNP